MTTQPSKRKKKSALVLGAGPAGLYFALLLKKADPTWDVEVWERNPAGVTYGWGVVFSDRTLALFAQADSDTYEAITDGFVIWDAIDVRYRGETVRCGGHVIAAISRKELLDILQARCRELGVKLVFERDITNITEFPPCDLLVAADGVNSLLRREYEDAFQPRIEMGRAKYIWLGADAPLDAFTFIFHETEYGLFQVHAYPFNGTTSTFIVECTEETWLKAGLDNATEADSLAFCQNLLNNDLGGKKLLSNNSKWINFPTLRTRRWHRSDPKSPIPNVVLLGDAAHTAHFSIGSGTKLAMEDAISLANSIATHNTIPAALGVYEIERKPVVETFQRAARESQTYFETLSRYLVLPPMQFAFQLLTRSGRVTYDDLRGKDTRFADAVDRRFVRDAPAGGKVLYDPPPIFAPYCRRKISLPNRIALTLSVGDTSGNGTPSPERAPRNPVEALYLTEICAVSAQGRITPESTGLYAPEHVSAWARIREAVETQGGRVGVRLGHAGRRGSTRPRGEGVDRPLREGGWPIIAPSPLPYSPRHPVPAEITKDDMESVLAEFVASIRMALDAGFSLLQLDMSQGYLLSCFLSPLTNKRSDSYGGEREGRMKFPLEVFGAVRAAWPEDKPLSVALQASDFRDGGWAIEDAIHMARILGERGCDLIEVLAGGTVPEAEAPYSRGFLTHLSDRIRNEAEVPTLVGGYLVTTSDANTVLAGGRADLCLMAGWS